VAALEPHPHRFKDGHRQNEPDDAVKKNGEGQRTEIIGQAAGSPGEADEETGDADKETAFSLSLNSPPMMLTNRPAKLAIPDKPDLTPGPY
jgi:hypothetical protein